MAKFDAPIAAIRSARTHSELDDAMAKYRQQLFAETPALRANYALTAALHEKRYFHALRLVPIH